MSGKLVHIKFPDNIDEMFDRWQASKNHAVGYCLLCDSPIATDADLINGTDTHNCARGRALEARVSFEEAKAADKPLNREEQDALAWQIIHRCRPIPVEAATRRRPKDYRDIEQWLRDGAEFEMAWSEFLHAFFAAKVASFFAYPSPPSLSPGWQCILAGAADWLSTEFGLPHPSWVDEPRYFLAEPWDPWMEVGLDVSEFIADTMARSPKAFSKRNVAFLSRNLITL